MSVPACLILGFYDKYDSFTVLPRPREMRRDQPAFKVKSILKGTEFDGEYAPCSFGCSLPHVFPVVSRQELVVWLQQQIAEQKRIDASTSGTPILSETSQGPVVSKDLGSAPDIYLVLPGDQKKLRKQTKQMFIDRGESRASTYNWLVSLTQQFPAFEMGVQIQNAVQSGIPVLAIDVPGTVFDLLSKSASWVTDDDAWKIVTTTFPTQNTGYAVQVREAAARKRADGHRFVLLFAVRDERVHLLTLS